MSFIGLLRVMGVDFLIVFNFIGPSAKFQEGKLCWERTMIDRHTGAIKSILLALLPLCVHIRSNFYTDGVYLSTL